MQSGEKEVHTQEGEKHGEESNDGHEGCLSSSPANGQTLMEQGRIEKPRNQGPGFFWVPIPISSPGIIGPDRARDDSQSQEGETEFQGLIIQIIQDFQRGKPSSNGPHFLRFKLVLLNQIHHAGTER